MRLMRVHYDQDTCEFQMIPLKLARDLGVQGLSVQGLGSWVQGFGSCRFGSPGFQDLGSIVCGESQFGNEETQFYGNQYHEWATNEEGEVNWQDIRDYITERAEKITAWEAAYAADPERFFACKYFISVDGLTEATLEKQIQLHEATQAYKAWGFSGIENMRASTKCWIFSRVWAEKFGLSCLS